MKFYSFLTLILLAGSITLSAQFDDLYYTPEYDREVIVDVTPASVDGNEYTYSDNSYDRSNDYDRYDDYEYYSDYDNYYASRIRRFNRVNRCGFDYFHPFYGYNVYGTPAGYYAAFNDPYGYNYNPYRFNRGVRISIGSRWVNSGWGYGYYSHYNPWNNPWNNFGYGNNYFVNNYYGYNNYNQWGCPSGGNGYNSGFNNGNNGGGANYDDGTVYGSRGGGSTASSTAGLTKSPRSVSPRSPKTGQTTQAGVASDGKGRVLQNESGPVRTAPTSQTAPTTRGERGTYSRDTNTQQQSSPRVYNRSNTPSKTYEGNNRSGSTTTQSTTKGTTRSGSYNRSTTPSRSTSPSTRSGSSSTRSSSPSGSSRSYRSTSPSRRSSGSTRSSSTRSSSPSSSSRSFRSSGSSSNRSSSTRSSSRSSSPRASSSRSSSSRSSSSSSRRGGR